MTADDFESELDIVAYHEAGHAVMAIACGFRLTELSINPSDVGRGFVGYVTGAALEGEIAQKAALVSVSGLVADMLLSQQSGKARPNDEFLGHFNDQENAHRYIRLCGQRGSIDDYMVLSMLFLRENWSHVSRFAEMLKVFPTMNPGALNLEIFPKLPEDWRRRLDSVVAQSDAGMGP
ncbi:hypothetical protein RFM99_06260 [Mesorhizobium sp. VK4C]|uniref:hypothetical protein n=1 Tax=Mesorhizobium captivum TaxID=3072319 RepID=UPI002A24E92E|nr:hypothetical protein [Mesorhizobium sp. VK4C]MDX8498017.1 hypothetical protein [Mesorhizobium sp. VK4C]